MQPKSVFFGGIGVLAIVAIVFICTRHHEIGIAEKITSQPTSDQFKNLHEFLDHIFGGRILEFHLKNLTKPGDGKISDIRALDVKLRKNNHASEVIRHSILMNE